MSSVARWNETNQETKEAKEAKENKKNKETTLNCVHQSINQCAFGKSNLFSTHGDHG
jgi:hypothetical protein